MAALDMISLLRCWPLLQAGARLLSTELASPPIDLVLAEAAAAIIQHCRPAVSQEAGMPVQEAVPAAVLSYLSRRVGLGKLSPSQQA